MEENDGSMFLVMEMVSEHLTKRYNDLLEELKKFRSEFMELCVERRTAVDKLGDEGRRYIEEGIIPSVDLNKALDSISLQIKEDYSKAEAVIDPKILQMKEIYHLRHRIDMTRKIALIKSIRSSKKDELICMKAISAYACLHSADKPYDLVVLYYIYGRHHR
ncbi:hypothetical protein FRX31_028875 [Thalictrum thalictroides]|uniref:Uncharacterized protein n=1 Tax=Thalictrum thalictroides TaxID=46969 RepID=A0A7J6V933_THATH|nr:hypothetical protein FRX31_028875 [Thalictrum thalictroides]